MPTRPWPIRVGSLLLREARPDDIETLLALRNDPVVNRFMLRTRVDPEAFRQEWLAVPDSETDFSCVAELDGQVVAMGFLDVVDGMGQPGMPKRTEGVIGYIVDPALGGRGVGSSLTRGLLAAAFRGLGLRRVTASCNADNPASARVLEKAGMRREQHGIEDSWHADLGWVDGYQYALLDREWHRRRVSNLEEPRTGHQLLVGEADAELDARLSAELTRFNYAASGVADQREFTVKVQDENGELLAGLSGWTWGPVAGISMVWVHDQARRLGWGAQLLCAAETLARDRGCRRIVVSSFTFQAPAFYAHHGYVETARITDYPLDGVADVYLVKSL